MASWTVPTIFATGDVLDIASANTWSNDITFLYQAPYINAYASASVSVASNTGVTIPLDSTLFSAYGASLNTSTNAIVVPLSGLYWVNGLTIITLDGGLTQTSVNHNGSLAVRGTTPYTSTQQNIWSAVSGIIPMSAGDNLALTVVQNSTNTETAYGGNTNNNLSAFFIGSQ